MQPCRLELCKTNDLPFKQRPKQRVAFQEAVAHYECFGIKLQRVMTDKGPSFHARAFAAATLVPGKASPSSKARYRRIDFPRAFTALRIGALRCSCALFRMVKTARLIRNPLRTKKMETPAAPVDLTALIIRTTPLSVPANEWRMRGNHTEDRQAPQAVQKGKRVARGGMVQVTSRAKWQGGVHSTRRNRRNGIGNCEVSAERKEEIRTLPDGPPATVMDRRYIFSTTRNRALLLSMRS